MVPRDSTQETTTDMFPHISDDDKFLLIALLLALFFGLFLVVEQECEEVARG